MAQKIVIHIAHAQRMTLNFELDLFLKVLDRINEVSVKRGSDKRGSTVSTKIIGINVPTKILSLNVLEKYST